MSNVLGEAVRSCDATQHATRALVLAHQTGEEPSSSWGTPQGFTMLLPPDELHTKLEYTGRTWH